jgi:hypothetical protein
MFSTKFLIVNSSYGRAMGMATMRCFVEDASVPGIQTVAEVNARVGF